MAINLDFHTHILPCVDDGSQSVGDSVEMIRTELDHGIKTIVLTPHFYPQKMFPEDFLARRQCAIEQIYEQMHHQDDLPTFVPGAEVLYSHGMSQWEQLEQLTLGNTKYLLVEMPLQKWPESVYHELEAIHTKRGITPVLAHVERYLDPFRIYKTLRRLSELPVMLQINCSFILSKRTQRVAIKLLKEHKIHFIGSDCHSSVWRPPTMLQARNILMDKLDEQTLSFLISMEETFCSKCNSTNSDML